MVLLHDLALDGIRFSEAVRKDKKSYRVDLASAVVVQTPKLELLSDVANEQGERMPYVYLKLDDASEKVMRGVEQVVLDAAVENKATWFKKDLDDEFIRSSLKSYFKSNGALAVRVPTEAGAFSSYNRRKEPIDPSELRRGARVVCMLELSHVSFGKTEFGCLWKLRQALLLAQPAPPPPQPPSCMIEYAADDEEEPEQPAADEGDDEYFG